MGKVALKLKIMPESPETDLEAIKNKAKEKLIALGAIMNNIEEQPIAFGLKAVIVTVAWPEEQSTDEAEQALSSIENVSSVETIDYRRAIG